MNTIALPTEAQREYACRAQSTGEYAGSSLEELGWYCDNSDRGPRTVKQKQPNAWGLYDMHGGCSDWCLDWYGPYPSAALADPAGPSAGLGRVIRGGSWHDTATHSRSACRDWLEPSIRSSYLGFRLCAPSTADGLPVTAQTIPALNNSAAQSIPLEQPSSRTDTLAILMEYSPGLTLDHTAISWEIRMRDSQITYQAIPRIENRPGAVPASKPAPRYVHIDQQKIESLGRSLRSIHDRIVDELATDDPDDYIARAKSWHFPLDLEEGDFHSGSFSVTIHDPIHGDCIIRMIEPDGLAGPQPDGDFSNLVGSIFITNNP